MFNETIITVRGNIGREPRLFHNEDGFDVTFFPLAVTPRKRNRDTGEIADGRTIWYEVRVGSNFASVAQAMLKKGMKVIVHGRLDQRTYTDKNGTESNALQIYAHYVGVDLQTMAHTNDAQNAPKAEAPSEINVPIYAEPSAAYTQESFDYEM